MPKVSFNKNTTFFSDIKRDVEAYFVENNLKKTGNWNLYYKTLVLIPLALAFYATLLLVSMPAALALVLCAALGLTLSFIGFNVMHDACHGSYSSKKWVNDLLGLTLNALGGNAFIWRFKHNVIHHTYTNVDGVDDDIAKSPLIRQCETQKWVPAHRIQHIYMFLVYGISSIAWAIIMDFNKYLKQKVFTTPIQNMPLKEHLVFWVSKVLYGIFYVAIPVHFVGWGAWGAGFAVMHLFMGLSLAIVFQLAHVVENTEFELALTDTTLESEWAAHQIKTTANFARSNKLVSWCVGGLNYQVEHHLFPRMSHIHYPAISEIVKANCEKYDLPYNEYTTFGDAVMSHIRTMRKLGEKPQLAVA